MELKNVSLSFDGGAPVLRDINWRIEAPQVVVVRGARGSGKSLLARVIAGLLNPTQGQVVFNDDVVSDFSFEEFLPYRQNIGYSFDYGGLINNQTVYENLRLPLRYHRVVDGATAHDRVMRFIEGFGLQSVAQLRPFAISGGMRKEACVARALVMDPEVVILDEPTIGLDPRALEFLRTYLEGQIQRGHIRIALVFSDDKHLEFSGAVQYREVREGALVDCEGAPTAERGAS
jgi:ABC-type transporter Mla maintaining outer membrane lipid asymmetry ATPase subunit MlaF